MSKDLKNEYEELLDQEIPDLWSRIEPQLHEKAEIQEKTVAFEKSGVQEKTEAPVEIETQEMAEERQNVSAWQQDRGIHQAINLKESSHPSKGISGKWKPGRIMRYSGIAAALICLVIAIPVVMNAINAERFAKSDSSDMAYNSAADTTADMMAENTEMEADMAESVEAAEDTAASESVAEDAGISDSATEDYSASENTAAGSTDEATTEGTNPSEESEMAVKSSVLELQVKIVRVKAEDTGEYSYIAEILQVSDVDSGTNTGDNGSNTGDNGSDGSSVPEVGTQITITQPTDYVNQEGGEAEQLQKNQTYQIYVRVQEDAYILDRVID